MKQCAAAVCSIVIVVVGVMLRAQAPSGASQVPDGLVLPPKFTATVVADNLGPARHLAIRDTGDVYVSTRGVKGPAAVLAFHVDANQHAQEIASFGEVTGGTGIRFYQDMLYVSSPTSIVRYKLSGSALAPAATPETIVDGMPTGGFANRPIAFDGKGNLFVAVGGSGNMCTDPAAPRGSKPVGLQPCPALASRSGIWRFSATTVGQKFAEGEQYATGVRDMVSLEWSADFDSLYAAMQGRNGTNQAWPDMVSVADEANVAEELHKIVKGSNLGWPYTYYDAARHIRLQAPEYGGDNKTDVREGYSTPVVAFPGHSSPIDLVFYRGTQFPAAYRRGAFIAFHGGSGPDMAGGHAGYNVAFVPFDANGKPGTWQVFASGFAGPSPDDRNVSRARFRPIGLAVDRSGALVVVDSVKGRLWRISYAG